MIKTLDEFLLESMGSGAFGDIPVGLRDRLIKAGKDDDRDVLDDEVVKLIKSGQNSTSWGKTQRKQMTAAYNYGKEN